MPYFLAVSIAAIALILAPGIAYSFDIAPKLLILLLAAALAAIPLRRSRVLYLMILTVLSLAVSTAFSVNPALSFYGSGWRRYGALAQLATLLLACSISGQARSIVVFLRVVTIAGALTALYGIAQYFGWDPILPAAAYHIGEGAWTIVRPPSTLGYASYFATWLLFVVFWSTALPGRLPKIGIALAIAALLLTGTRAAVLGLLAGAAVWCFWRGFLFRAEQPPPFQTEHPRPFQTGQPPPFRAARASKRFFRLPRLSWRAIGVILLLAAAAPVFYFSPMGQMMRSRTRWFQEDPWGGARPLLWRDSLRAGLAHPVFGFGPETFSATFPRFESKELARAYPDFAHESPHNIFLDALVSQGMPGLLLLVAWCALGFAAAWRIRSQHPAVSAGLAAALAAGIVSQQFTVFIIPTAVIFFATVALAEGLHAGIEPGRRYLPLGLPLLYFAARMALDDHALLLTERALASGDLASAAAHYTRSHHADDLWYSRSLAAFAGKAPSLRLRYQAIQLAIAAGERATHTAEAPFSAWYSLSALRANQNDEAGTEFCLRSAIAAHPNWFKPHWILAEVLHAEGRHDEARREALTAIDLDAGKHPEVARALQEILH
jgi:O-antigen ligase